MTTSFDLTCEPWIPCVDLSDEAREVGSRCAGAPTNSVSWAASRRLCLPLHRLPLAITHRSTALPIVTPGMRFGVPGT